MEAEGMIEASDFTVAYRDFRLGPLDVSLRAGERVALVGANGAGKSTTLRAWAGRLDGYGGSVRILGEEVRERRARVRGEVGVVPESLLGLGWMTVAQHLDFLASFFPRWEPDYARALCSDLELSTEKPLSELSKGMKVKVGLVAALAHRPPVLLLDEPTSGIDPLMRDHLLATVDRAVPKGGRHVLVFSTHILEDIERVAERVLLLKQGRLVGDVRVDELRREAGDAPLSTVVRGRLAHA